MSGKNIRIIGLSDIRAFRLQCAECKGVVVIDANTGSATPPEYCPHCREEWPLRGGPGSYPLSHWRLLIAMKELLTGESPVTIEFETERDD